MTNEPSFRSHARDDHDATDRSQEGLLSGKNVYRDQSTTPRSAVWRQVFLFLWALIATASVLILSVVYQRHHTISHTSTNANANANNVARHPGKKNLIFMVSDGMGPASLSLARSFRQFEERRPYNDTLVLDKHLVGQSRTRSSNSLVTDSAAGATAFSCALKSYNGAISVTPDDQQPCGTVLEAAKLAGYMTGMVVTTRITDATPACFGAHAKYRHYEDLIAEHEIGEYPLGRMVDLMLGGGRCHFLPNATEGSCRHDEKDLIRTAKHKGFNYVHDRKGFDALGGGKSAQLPLLGLFAPTDIPFEIDRRHVNDLYPSLEETTRTALQILSDATKDSDQGFFIMIEGSRIDHAGHGNDPAAQAHEVLAYDKAFAAVLEFLENDSTPTVVVGTSDHETGGLSLSRQLSPQYPEYKWLPEVLARAQHSSEFLHAELLRYLKGNGFQASDKDHQLYVRHHILERHFGINDATDEEVETLIHPPPESPPAFIFADMISRRAQIGWATHGHSG